VLTLLEVTIFIGICKR